METESKQFKPPRLFKPFGGPALTCPACHELHNDWYRKTAVDPITGEMGVPTAWFCRHCGTTSPHAEMGIQPDVPALNTEEVQPDVIDQTPKTPTLDEYYERGRRAAGKGDAAKWEIGDNAVDMVKDHGLKSMVDYAKEIGRGARSVQDYYRLAVMFEPVERRKFQKQAPNVFYSHFLMALALGNVDTAYKFLSAVQDETWTVDEAEFHLRNDAEWGLKKDPPAGGDEGDDDSDDDSGDTDQDEEIVVEGVTVCMTGAVVRGGVGTLAFTLDMLDMPAFREIMQGDDREFVLTLSRRV